MIIDRRDTKSLSCPDPASCTMGTGSFPGVKRPGRGADRPPSSKCRGHERVGLYLYSPSGPQWPVIGRTFTFTLIIIAAATTGIKVLGFVVVIVVAGSSRNVAAGGNLYIYADRRGNRSCVTAG